jgi:NTE family protein
VDLVLEGGGVKGVALVGALAALEDQGYIPQNIAGTSVGAIVGALLAAGYSAAELRDIMMNQLDFRRLRDLSLEGQLPLIGKPLNLLCSLGIYEGKVFEEQMEAWLKAKGVRTFKDLRFKVDDADENAVYRYKLQVIASDLTAKRMLVLPRDAGLLGIRPDRMSVAQAVRMSMSVPIFFEPVQVTGPKGVKHYIVDGALLSNFPVWLFDSPGVPAWPTFGLHLVNAFQFTGITDRIPPIETAGHSPTPYPSWHVPAGPGCDGAGGPRLAVHRTGELRSHDPHSYRWRGHRRLRHPAQAERGTVRGRLPRRGGIFGALGF